MAGGIRSSVAQYFTETRRPIYSAALVLPFFLVYHIGTVFSGSTYINGADALIIRLLSALSVHSAFASAIVLLGCFVIWQLRTRASWDLDTRKLTLLFAESLGYALLLLILFSQLPALQARPSGSGTHGFIERIVLYCGAGIYEELVFRGFLLGALILAATRLLHMNKLKASVSSALVAAILFAVFHYIGPRGDPFSWSTFLQRTCGGLYFSVLFVTRGFGVTAASHALYDVLVGMVFS